jgi:hypothetical protein
MTDRTVKIAARVTLPTSATNIVANVVGAFVAGVVAGWGVQLGGLGGAIMLAGAILGVVMFAIGARFATLSAFWAGGVSALEAAEAAMRLAQEQEQEQGHEQGSADGAADEQGGNGHGM